MRRNLFEEIRDAGVAVVAKKLGLTVLDFPAPGSITPCPSCHREQRYTGDRRGPIGLSRGDREGIGWRCHRCDAGGDALSLAALVLTGSTRPDKEGWRQIRAKFMGTEPLPVFVAPPRELRRPPIDEVLDVWEKSTNVYDSDELVPILEERALDPGMLTERDLCRRIKRGYLPYWATFGGRPWNEIGLLLVVPLYSAAGTMESLHVRRLEKTTQQKACSPLGYDLAGLSLMDSLGRALFSGSGSSVTRLVITEGVPDYLTAASSFGDENTSTAVMGVLSGSWTKDHAAQIERLPQTVDLVIATHNDSAGDRYARKIAETLRPSYPATRWRL